MSKPTLANLIKRPVLAQSHNGNVEFFAQIRTVTMKCEPKVPTLEQFANNSNLGLGVFQIVLLQDGCVSHHRINTMLRQGLHGIRKFLKSDNIQLLF